MQNYETVLNDMQPKCGKLFVPKNKCGLYDIIPAEDFSAENTVKDAIDDLQTQTQDKIDNINNRIRNINDDIDDLESIIPSSRFSAQSTVKDYIDNEVSEVADLLPSSAFDSVNTVRGALNGRVRAFETVADMAAATDLVADMICHTNGFHTSGDGGAAFYEIKANGTANAKNIIACQDSLLAHLVITEPFVTPEQLGAYGDGTHDDTSILAFVFDKYENVIFGESKTYKCTDVIAAKSTNVDFNNSTLAFTISPANKVNALDLVLELTPVAYTTAITENQNTFTLSGANVGDIILFESTDTYITGYNKGLITKVLTKNGTSITCEPSAAYGFTPTQATIYKSKSINYRNGNIIVNDANHKTICFNVNACSGKITNMIFSSDGNRAGLCARACIGLTIDKITASNFTDYARVDNRSGYGCVISGHNINVINSVFENNKHNISTSDRDFMSSNFTISNNIVFSDYNDTDSLDAAIDCHANLKNITFENNTITVKPNGTTPNVILCRAEYIRMIGNIVFNNSSSYVGILANCQESFKRIDAYDNKCVGVNGIVRCTGVFNADVWLNIVHNQNVYLQPKQSNTDSIAHTHIIYEQNIIDSIDNCPTGTLISYAYATDIDIIMNSNIFKNWTSGFKIIADVKSGSTGNFVYINNISAFGSNNPIRVNCDKAIVAYNIGSVGSSISATTSKIENNI